MAAQQPRQAEDIKAVDTKRLLASKPVIVMLLFCVAFLANLRYRQYRQQRDIEREKQELIKQTNDLQQKNDQLSQSLSYLGSDSFKERIARQQLNLQRDGEIVYTFTEGSQATTAPEIRAPEDSAGQSPNAAKWWRYFFGDR